MQEKLLINEKVELLNQAIDVGTIRLVQATFAHKPNDALKTLGNLLREEAETVGVFIHQQGDNIGVVVSASDDSGIHAGNLLKAILADFDGRGGGGQPYAQGVCKGLADISALSASIETKVREALQ